MVTKTDHRYLERCLELAKQALREGDEPFGSVLVSTDGEILFEGYNEVVSQGDPTQHPEIAIARWSAHHMDAKERANATVYTSGEHCPMCAAAHGWVGLGRIVYISSSKQLTNWLDEFKVTPSKVRPLSIREVITDVDVDGPVNDLAYEVKQLHRLFHQQK